MTRAERTSAALFDGVGVALVTLFDDRGEVDAAATGELAARLVEAGVRGVVVAGTTGEGATLERGERVALVDAVAKAVGGAAPVWAGTGAPSSRQAATLTVDAIEAGADAVLALCPTGATDPIGYYRVVADAAGDVPVAAYHYPKVAPPGIPSEALPDLPAAALKDSTGDADRLLVDVTAFPGAVYTGAPPVLLAAGAVGARGAILALANARPEVCAAAFAGDGDAQRRLLDDHRAAQEAFPTGIKRLAAERFATSAVARAG